MIEKYVQSYPTYVCVHKPDLLEGKKKIKDFELYAVSP